MITGATAGIGAATAKLLWENNYNIIITGRRSERLNELALQLNTARTSSCLPLKFDVRSKEQVKEAIANLSEEWSTIQLLVNNAGLAIGKEPIQMGRSEDWDAMIDTNVKGLLYVTEAVLPLIPQDGTGHIVNVSSIAGLQSYPNGNVYCASKHAVEGLPNVFCGRLTDQPMFRSIKL